MMKFAIFALDDRQPSHRRGPAAGRTGTSSRLLTAYFFQGAIFRTLNEILEQGSIDQSPDIV
jgi:hypothetical protein